VKNIFIIIIIFSTPLFSQKINLYPSNPSRGEFFIVRISSTNKTNDLYKLSIGNTSFPLLDKKNNSFSGYGAIPLFTSTTTVLVLKKNNINVSSVTLIIPPKKEEIIKPVKVSTNFVKLPSEIFFKLEKEKDILKKVRDTFTTNRFFDGYPIFPVLDPILGSGFGERRLFNDEKDSIHFGQDIVSKSLSVRTIFNGKVILTNEFYFAGKTVFIDHGFGLISQYSHLNEIKVKIGDFVKKGDLIGEIGQTGRVTGPHLHWAFYINKLPVDPLTVFSNCKKFIKEE